MNERELERELCSTPVPAASRDRAARSILSATAANRGGRRWRVPLAGVVGLIAGFAFTAPGQATVEWVAETIHLQDPEGSGFSLTDGKTVGVGTSPAGHRYRVLAYPAGEAGVCLQLEPPGEEIETRARSFSESNCVSQGDSDSEEVFGGDRAKLNGQPSYIPLRGGGVVALGGVGDAVTSVQVSDGQTGVAIDADLFPISGEAEQADGSTQDLPAFNAYVAFLPAGAGDVQEGAPAKLTGRSSDGDVVLTGQLSWVTSGEGTSALAVNCAAGEPDIADVCSDARAGELNRVDERLARPLPSQLAALLTRAGYSYVPASDDDRGLAADPEFDLKPRSSLALSAFMGLAYEIYAGRLSGAGFDGRLVYVLRDFPAFELPDEGAGIGLRAADERADGLVGTFVVDAITGETLDRLGAG